MNEYSTRAGLFTMIGLSLMTLIGTLSCADGHQLAR